jgi:Homeodomain-like domain
VPPHGYSLRERKSTDAWPGRQPLDADLIAAALKLVQAGLSPTVAARQLGLGRSTVYREISRTGIERAHSSPNLQRGAGILPIKMIRTRRRNGLFRCLISGGAVTIKRRQATVQNASVSDEAMSIPRTSRRPSLLTPTTRIIGADTMRRLQEERHGLQVAAAKLGSGNGARDERRLYIIPELDL